MEQDAQLIQQLAQAGLGDKAARVYAFLFLEGGAYPSTIALRTHLNRSTVYKVLTELTIQGLVNEVERGKKLYYTAESPQKLVRLTKRKVETAGDQLAKAEALLPDLLQQFGATGERPRMRYFEGHDALLTIYEDHVQKTKPYEMLAIANSIDVLNFLPDKFYTKYRAAKVRYGITTRGILPIGTESEHIATEVYSDVPKELRPNVRYLEPQEFPLAGEIVLYRDDCISIVHLEEGRMSGIIIEDKAVYTMLKTMFNLAWAGAKAETK